LPSRDCVVDVSVLPLLGPATKQDHKNLAILAEVNAVARPKIECVFVNTGAYALNIRKITQSDSSNRCGHFGGSLGIQTVEPFGEWTASALADVLVYRDPVTGAIYVTNVKRAGAFESTDGL
jgi:hypothetical protein